MDFSNLLASSMKTATPQTQDSVKTAFQGAGYTYNDGTGSVTRNTSFSTTPTATGLVNGQGSGFITPTPNPNTVALNGFNSAVAGSIPSPYQQNPTPTGAVGPTATATNPAGAPTGTPAGGQPNYADPYIQAMQTAGANMGTALNNYTNEAINGPTKSGAEAQFYDQYGVNTAAGEYKQSQNNLLSEQVANQHSVNDIRQNADGTFGGVVDARVQSQNTASLSRQADLSVIQLAAQGKYETAKAVADRYVDAVIEQHQNKLDALKLTYEANKDLFTTSEQQAFTVQQQQRQYQLDLQKTNMQAISDLSVEALRGGASGAVASAMRSAPDLASAMKIGGRFVGAADRALKFAQVDSAHASAQASMASARLSGAELAGKNLDNQIKVATLNGSYVSPDQQQKNFDAIQKAKEVNQSLTDKMAVADKISGVFGSPSSSQSTFANVIQGAKTGFLNGGVVGGVTMGALGATGLNSDANMTAEQKRLFAGMNERVGPNMVSRGLGDVASLGRAPFSAAGNEFASYVHQLTSEDTLKEMQAQMAEGKLPRMNETEFNVIKQAATMLTDAENKDAKGNGDGTWDLTTDSFKTELGRIVAGYKNMQALNANNFITPQERNVLNAASKNYPQQQIQGAVMSPDVLQSLYK